MEESVTRVDLIVLSTGVVLVATLALLQVWL